MTVAQQRPPVGLRLASAWREPMQRAGLLLAANAALSSLLGFAYWLVASRMLPEDVVGMSSAAVSVMQLLAALAQLNLMSAMLRFVPVAARPMRLSVTLLAFATGLTAVVASVYVVRAGSWTPALARLLSSPADRAWMVVGAVGTTALVMLSSGFVAFGRAGWSFAVNTAFGALKIALLVVIARVAPEHGIWYSWALSTVLALVVALAGFALVARARRAPDGADVTLRRLIAFAAPDYLGAMAWFGAISLTPVLVLELGGVGPAAAVGIPWQVAMALFALPAALGQSVVAHGVADTARLDEHHRAGRRLTLLILTPVVVVLVVASPLVLRVFGSWYADNSADLLRLLALAAIPNALLALDVSVSRVRNRMRRVAVLLLSLAVTVTGLTVALLPVLGANAAGVAWLVGESAVVGGSMLADRRRGRRAVVRATAVPPAGKLLERARRGRSDTEVAITRSTAGWAVVKAATTPPGRSQVAREATVLRRLRDHERLGEWRSLVPRLLHVDERALVTTRLPGNPPSRPVEIGGVLATLHRLEAVEVVVDDALVDRLVTRPARIVAAAPIGPKDRARLDALAEELRVELLGRRVRLGWTHGDFWPGNLLVDVHGQVSGIVDWAQARDEDLTVLDNVHWLLTNTRRPLLAEVRRRIEGTPFTPAEEAFVGDGQPLPVDGRTLVLLAWLRHVADNLEKSQRFGASPWWVHRAIRNVLRSAVA